MPRGSGGFIGGFNPLNEVPVDYSGLWGLKEQLQALAAGKWTGLPTFSLFGTGQNPGGQIGDNTTINRTSFTASVDTSTTWDTLGAGNGLNAATKSNGTLWTWGYNNNGALGLGDTSNKSSPTQVGVLTNWSEVAGGSAQCVHRLALKTDGTLWAWGNNAYGQLGDSTVVSKSSPTQVGALTNWSYCSVGASHSGAITTSNALYLWGGNSNGQQGDNSLTSKSSPVQVSGSWVSVSLGTAHSAAIRTDGTVWTWGSNGEGRLGIGNNANKSSPVQVGALTTWASVAAGTDATFFLRSDNTLWAAGDYDSCAVPSNSGTSSPVQVGAAVSWAQASVGNNFGLGVSTGNVLYAWGRNSNGNLGTGDTTKRTSPSVISGTWSVVRAGNVHTVALARGTTN